MSRRFPLAAALLFACTVTAQVTDAPDAMNTGIPVNYTEAKVGTYPLPDPLKLANGGPVSNAGVGSPHSAYAGVFHALGRAWEPSIRLGGLL